MNKLATAAVFAAIALVTSRPSWAGNRPPDFQVVPFERNDPLNLVRSAWEKGTGCPTTSTVPELYNCMPVYDGDDHQNQGLLLAKSGSGPIDPGQAGATLTGVSGWVIPDATTPILGYDIRKDFTWTPGVQMPGSHCGQPYVDPSTGQYMKGSPRFEVQVGGNWYFVACGTPSYMEPAAVQGWTRLRWAAADLLDQTGAPVGATLVGQSVTAVQIVFDDGPDLNALPPDMLGLAVLDNVFAWWRIEGDGTAKAQHPSDEDEGAGEDHDHDSCHHRHSDSQPDRNEVTYHDPSKKMAMKSTNIRSASYQGNCVNLLGDALVNGKSGYTYTYQACDLSTGLVPGIGSFNIAINGPGLTYSKSALMTSGYVYNHPHL